ncbi:type II secretion system protein GspM [Hellea sp.]|jgi:type II secretory pathway component PulM|nr:type II secretion system protein GspM [Hellea sp.]MDA8889069.1 type II secretion system protein M [Hellea sp.]MDB4844104.1 type II secretion system protein M [Hellea sp.]MDC1061960.1 type II secretion system protein GspM [Hellea sp.]MDC1088883.1 type II secretion system protein GspM [Hellea sp.]
MNNFIKWNQRESYEKVIISLTAVMALGFIIYIFAYNPIRKLNIEANLQVSKAISDYELVANAVPKLSEGTLEKEVIFNRDILIQIARENSINLSRINPTKESLVIWVDNVETIKMYEFIQSLINVGGANLTRASISINDNSLLSAQLTLR